MTLSGRGSVGLVSGASRGGSHGTEGSDAHLHLVIDGYGGDRDALENAELIRDFLERHPGEIGMTKIAPPQVYTYRGKEPETGAYPASC